MADLFDRKILLQNHRRFASKFKEVDFLHHQIADILCENVSALNQDFQSVLEIGAKDFYLLDSIAKNVKVEEFFLNFFCKNNFEFAKSRDLKLSNSRKSKDIKCRDIVSDKGVGSGLKIFDAGFKTIFDDSEIPNLEPEKFDLILSNLTLHHINQVPQFLVAIRQALKEKGVFVASFFGENNLIDLKRATAEAENKLYGGISPRMIPMIDVKNAAMLLQKAGFRNPVSSLETIDVEYGDGMKFLRDLQFMGQGNVLLKRSKRFMTKKFLDEILNEYAKIKGLEGRVVANFEIVTMIGWK